VDDASRGTFRLGVNYWPAEAAMEWMQVYDPAGTRRDFNRAAAAGFDTLRIRFFTAEPVTTSSAVH